MKLRRMRNMTHPAWKLRIGTLALTVVCALVAPAADKKDAQKETPPAKVEVSIFKDKNLEAAVRRYVFEKRDTDKPITADDVAKLSVIEARGKGIADLSGLEHCKALAMLDVANNQIRDISALKDMKILQSLTLSANRIEDMAPLKAVTALQYIELSGNKVKDIAPLSGLTNMASLYLSTNQITDMSALLGMKRLSSLYLDHNQLDRIDGINALSRLSSLSLSANRIKDIGPLKGLNGLYHLFLEENLITDLTPLAEMIEIDAKGEQRFAPFLNLYLKGNPLKVFFKGKKEISRMEKAGARIQSK